MVEFLAKRIIKAASGINGCIVYSQVPYKLKEQVKMELMATGHGNLANLD